jgi:acetyl esterase/lipase
MMSLRAELLRLSMRAWKLSKSNRRHMTMTKVRSRLRLIEPLVPQPPSGTKLNAIDVDGIKATEILVPEARPDRHVLYFHGGGYAFGTEPDAAKVFRWLAARINPDRIAFIGDSAGGGLLLATLHKMRDEGFKLPSAAVALSPWTG